MSEGATGQPRPSPIPGPTLWRLIAIVLAARGDRWEVTRRLVRRYGDLVRLRLPGRTFFVAGHPDVARDVLVSAQRRFAKGPAYARLRAIQGDGLATADGEEWRRQREELQRFFTPRHAAGYGPAMVTAVEEWLARVASRRTFELGAEMKWIGVVSATSTLFHVDARPDAERMVACLDAMLAAFQRIHRYVLPLTRWLERLPWRVNRALREAHRTLDALLYAWIDERAALAPDERPVDVLTAVASGADRTTREGLARRRAARDKLLTLLAASVETTSAALCAAWYWIARTPGVDDRLHAEIAATCGSRPPTVEDVERMPYLDRVLREVLRLNPGAASLSRSPSCPVDLKSRAVQIPADASIGFSAWLIHRDARFFECPEEFVAERWEEGRRSAAAERAYFPFGLGARRCIGEHFALLELKLTVATIVQRARVVFAPGAAPSFRAATLVAQSGRWIASLEPR
jgi:cytochrome P450